MITFSLHNFGCRVNQAESFAWAEALQARGLRLAEDFRRSDYVVINSCTLTNRADSDVRQFIRKVARENPAAKLIVTGCYAEGKFRELKGMPSVWLLCRNSEKDGLAERMLDAISRTSAEEERGRFSSGPVTEISPFRSRAILKVQDGCDFHCAFCVIPSVRGKSRSAAEEKVIADARHAVERGFREVVLAGVHLCSYGLDLDPPSSLLALLHRVEQVEGLEKVRLSSLDPRFLFLPFVEHLTASPKICRHFHLSLQHGSDGILKTMGRSARREDFERILWNLRHNAPDAALGADIIVGFPGETDEDFGSTRDFLARSPLSYFHVFSYSPRRGTQAARLEQVDEGLKKRRSAELRELSKAKNLAFRRGAEGKEFEGIVIRKGGGNYRAGLDIDEDRDGEGIESFAEKKLGTADKISCPDKAEVGPEPAGEDRDSAEILTSNYIKVIVPECPYRERDAVRVRITRAAPLHTVGEVVDAGGRG